MAMLGGPFIVLSIELAEPVKEWMERVPELSAELTKHLDDFGEKPRSPGTTLQRMPAASADSASKDSGFRLFGWFRDDEEPVVAPPIETAGDSALVESVKKGGIEVLISLLAATPFIICTVYGLGNTGPVPAHIRAGLIPQRHRAVSSGAR